MRILHNRKIEKYMHFMTRTTEQLNAPTPTQYHHRIRFIAIPPRKHIVTTRDSHLKSEF